MFYLKKFIASFLMPVPIGLFLFALGVYFLFRNSYTKAKVFLFLTLTWFALLSYSPVANAILAPLENSHKALLQTPKVDYILVLGNGHTSNENLSITSQVNPIAINRLVEGIKHYNALNKNVKFIVSGYGGYDKNSHAFMQEILASNLGVNKKDIIRFDKARDTHEEALNIKELLGNKKFIIVTSASHMKRSMLIFKKLNLNAIAAPTNYLSHEEKNFKNYFSGKNIRKIEIAIHEYLGLLWYKIKGYI